MGRQEKAVAHGVRVAAAVMACLLLGCGGSAALRGPAGGAGAVVLYVAPDGNDAWSGRSPRANAARTDGPLATLAGARDAVRRLRDASPTVRDATVLLRGGTYRMTQPFVLGPRDSGVTYAARRGEKPILSGGRVIRNWKPGPGGLWSAEVPEAAQGKWQFQQLFVNGVRRTRARSPNDGTFTVVGKAPPAADAKPGKDSLRDKTAFVYRPGDIRPWPGLADAQVVVYHSWETSRLRIARLDEANHAVEFTGPAAWAFENWGTGQRYFVENVREALDAPGEWFLDSRAGVVYYYPLPGEDLRRAEVVAPFLTRLVEIAGAPDAGLWVENVAFRGLTFCHEDWELEPTGHSDAQAVVTAPAAIMADGALRCTIEGCEIAHVGHYAVWLRRACRENRIARNRIHDLGVGGVRIGEAATPASEAVTSSHNVVDNNHLFDGGHVYPAGVGIWVAQSHHNTISHNEIHDFNYSGMSIGWNWDDAPNRCHDNVIELNHVHHVMSRQLNDGGAIYTLGASPGSVIRHNVFHDVWPHSAIGWGVYLDATTSGYLVEDNIVYNTLSGGLMKHNGGHENVIRNNVFAFSADQMLWPCWDKKPNVFERNIVYFTQGTLFIPFAEARLSQRLAAHESLGVWDNNVYWNPSQPDLRFFRHRFADWQAKGIDAHSVVADPLFRDSAAYDFRLRPNSPALKLGFQPIATASVGLYGDRAWVAEARRVTHPPTRLPAPPGPPKPIEVDDDFEATPAGSPPRGATVSGEEQGASIRVADDAAAAGRHSLKISDAAGLQPSWQPHFYYQPHLTGGRVRQSFDILLRPDALLFTEWRDEAAYPACIGPSVTFDGAGRVVASGKPLATIPVGEWVHVEIECELRPSASSGRPEPAEGRQAARPGAYSVTLQPAGKPAERFEAIPYAGADFAELHWLGFVSTAATAAVVHIDNLRIQRVK